MERDHKDFWTQMNRMIGRRTTETVMTIKDENGRELKSKEGVVQAFRKRMEKTLKISQEEMTILILLKREKLKNGKIRSRRRKVSEQ